MLDDTTRNITIDVKGEQTRMRYEGEFVVKLFLTHKEKMDVAREVKTVAGNLAATAPAWDIKSFIDSVNDMPSTIEAAKKKMPDAKDEDLVFLSEMAKLVVANYALGMLPPTPQTESFMADIVLLGKHIISAPDWWVKANNGKDLLDQAPVQALAKSVTELIDGLIQEDEEGEENATENTPDA